MANEQKNTEIRVLVKNKEDVGEFFEGLRASEISNHLTKPIEVELKDGGCYITVRAKDIAEPLIRDSFKSGVFQKWKGQARIDNILTWQNIYGQDCSSLIG